MQDRRGRDHGLADPDLGSSTAIPDRPRPTTPNPSVAPIQFRHSHDKPVRDLERQLLCGRLNLARNESRLGPVIECAVRQPKFTATPIAVFVASKLPSPPGKTDPATFKVSLVCDSWWSCCCRYRTTCADNSLSPCPVEAPENRRSRRRSRVILRVQVPVVGPENARAKPRWRSKRLSSSQRRRRPSERSVPKARTPKTRATDSHPDPGVPRGSPDPSDGAESASRSRPHRPPYRHTSERPESVPASRDGQSRPRTSEDRPMLGRNRATSSRIPHRHPVIR